MRRRFVALSMTAALTAVDGGARAQETGATQLQEVVVQGQGTAVGGAEGVVTNEGYVPKTTRTATKTDTPVNETPLTINTVTQKQIQDRNPQSLAEALSYTPGVRIGGYGFDPRFDSFTIRGVDITYTGIFRDGLRQYSSPSGQFRLEPYGLESISVLKGPASSVYGASASVGIIDMISKRPTPYRFGEVGVETGSFDRKQASFDLGGPLNDKGTLYYRLTFLGRNANTDLGAVPDDRLFIAPALTFKPNEKTQVTLLSEYMYSATGGSTAYENSYAPYTLQDGTVISAPTGANHDKLFNPDYNKFTQEQGRLGYEFQHRFNDTFSFQQNLRWSGLATNERFSSDAYAGQVKEHVNALSVDTYLKTEVATGPVDHTILTGTDFGYLRYDSRIGYNFEEISSPDLPEETRQRQTMIGAYVQDELKTGPWRLLVGGRHDWLYSKYYVPADTTGTGFAETTKDDQGEYTGRAGLSYVTAVGVTPYVSYGTSFNANSGTILNGGVAKPTTGQSAEAGVKYAPPGYNAFINASLFWLKQDDGIVYTVIDSINRQTQLDFRSRGFEIEGVASLMAGFSLQASYSYTDTQIEELSPDTEGNEINSVPRHAFMVWGGYDVPEGLLKGLGLGLGVRYTGSSFGDDYNRSVIKNDAQTFVDAKASYDLGGLGKKYEGIQLQLNATNLFNKVDQVCTASYCYYNEGRKVIASLRYRW